MLLWLPCGCALYETVYQQYLFISFLFCLDIKLEYTVCLDVQSTGRPLSLRRHTQVVDHLDAKNRFFFLKTQSVVEKGSNIKPEVLDLSYLFTCSLELRLQTLKVRQTYDGKQQVSDV